MTHRHTSAGALRRLVETIRLALCKQNEIEFAAPWNPRRPTC
jgi:hypothetical protein